MPLIDNAVINSARLAEQAVAPGTPASGFLSLYALATGLRYKTDAGTIFVVGLVVSAGNVSSPPTDAELDALFGTPATVGAGFTAVIDDAGGGTNIWLVYSTGAVWGYSAFTVAV